MYNKYTRGKKKWKKNEEEAFVGIKASVAIFSEISSRVLCRHVRVGRGPLLPSIYNEVIKRVIRGRE